MLLSCHVLATHNLNALFLQANVRNYFMQFEEAQTQSLIDSKIMEFEMKSRQGLQVAFCLLPWLKPPAGVTVNQALHVCLAANPTQLSATKMSSL